MLNSVKRKCCLCYFYRGHQAQSNQSRAQPNAVRAADKEPTQNKNQCNTSEAMPALLPYRPFVKQNTGKNSASNNVSNIFIVILEQHIRTHKKKERESETFIQQQEHEQ